ncbi:hypothetical protein FACS189413_16380 [Bacteroidia bacterium]|nr:hypothetical protein FACS189413_16380 [Bacteroidia bacterium]
MKRRVTHIESAYDENLPAYMDWDTYFDPVTLVETETDYVDNKIYKDGRLKLILTAEGYIDRDDDSIYTFHYYLKDHLGNNRVVINQDGEVEQITNYYPSGTVMAEKSRRTDQGVQPYKFSNKELDRSNGLDFYDFVWRQQDPTLMRFTMPDPLMEMDYFTSPYAYCGNNPVSRVDPWGLHWESDGYDYDEEKGEGILYYTWVDDAEFRADMSENWSHYWDEFQDWIPAWGSNKQATEALNDGRYADAVAHHLMTWVEVFTSGSASAISKTTTKATEKASSWLAKVLGRTTSTTAANGGTTVYRAVDAVEKASVNSSKQFLLKEGGTEFKYFAKSLEDAHQFGKYVYKGEYSIIQGAVNPSVNIGAFWYPTVDNMGAYILPGNVLPYITPIFP